MAIPKATKKSELSTYTSSANSTNTPLSAGQIFIGQWETTSNNTSVLCALLTDQVGIVYIDFSTDGIITDSSYSYVVEANTNEEHRVLATREFFRIRFLNASVNAQTFIRLQTILGNHGVQTVPLNGTVQPDADAVLTKSIMYGLNSSGNTIAIKSIGNLLEGVTFDDVQTTFPTAITELHSYYLAAVLQRQVEVTFTDATKTIENRARIV